MSRYMLTALFLMAHALQARSPSLLNDSPRLRVHVYDDTTLSDKLVQHAESETSRLIGRSVPIQWLNCASPTTDRCVQDFEKGDVALRIVPHALPGMGPAVLGSATIEGGSGTYALVVYDRIKALTGPGVGSSSVMGKVMAHEITHLLLGAHSHASIGVMRPAWQRQEFSIARSNLWFYTPKQKAAMHQRLQRRTAIDGDEENQ